MKIFLSWSGSTSKLIAEALKDWLPYIIHSLEPWVSSSDIEAGQRWGTELGKELESTGFGILCLTEENINAPWILFEAGALAKSLENSHLCPYLTGLNPSDISGPLAQFQALNNDKQGTWKLVLTIYHASDVKNISESHLSIIFDRFWPDLEAQFHKIDLQPSKARIVRTERSILEEILSDVRVIKREMSPSRRSNLDLGELNPKLNQISLTIDISAINPRKRTVEYIVDSNDLFQRFLDVLWSDVVYETFEAFTYGKKWILVNVNTKDAIRKNGREDSRKINELNFSKDQALRIECV